ncbi:mechanosensitive ion channel family protein [Halovibrio sp. HP20-50]|uniref:mechanosensitive ion channel family protein n=1 Tax=Halovibrio sp. HP20-59 TaxID=3080275 RepID=UPI00294B2325|nr:mechanosensitive ion channel domain-containing protein [Halovibrio sp. HP20-59]MEA2117293.1 mechanosensitive ion channel [Halovibrio sp. HP20-59]
MLKTLEAGLQAWMLPGISSLLAVIASYTLYRLTLAVIRHFSKRRTVPRLFLDAAAKALGLVTSLLALRATLNGAPDDLLLLSPLKQVVTLLLILSLTWAAVRLTSVIGDVIVLLNPVLEGQWKRARRVETQTRFLVRCLNVLILIVGIGAALMTFEPVQKVGASLLASAGIGGIILGFAARPVFSNLLAGIQIALAQPFRIDDVLYVQGEWCWVEEVTATYVVLRVWDQRRLIVPLQWFIEHPFQNWSRNTTDLQGTVFIWVDYTMPIEPLRQEFLRLLDTMKQWDGKVATVQVTDSNDQALEVRFLMSARNSSQNWDLRCAIREGLVTYIQQHYPSQLPRLRARLVDTSPEFEDNAQQPE